MKCSAIPGCACNHLQNCEQVPPIFYWNEEVIVGTRWVSVSTFRSADEAVKAWAKNIYPTTRKEYVEYSANVY